MIKRQFEYNSFRTLGVGENIDKKNKMLIINQTDEGNLQVTGGVLGIIGRNNVGKSNVLDGILAYKNGCKDSDTTHIGYECPVPEVNLIVKKDTQSEGDVLIKRKTGSVEVSVRDAKGNWKVDRKLTKSLEVIPSLSEEEINKLKIKISNTARAEKDVASKELQEEFNIKILTRKSKYINITKLDDKIFNEIDELNIKRYKMFTNPGKGNYNNIKNTTKNYSNSYDRQFMDLYQKVLQYTQNEYNVILMEEEKYLTMEAVMTEKVGNNSSYNPFYYINKTYDNTAIYVELDELKESFLDIAKKESEEKIKSLCDDFGIPGEFLREPNIIDYSNSDTYKSGDLYLNYTTNEELIRLMKNSNFFTKLLNIVDIPTRSISRVLDQEKQRRGALRDLEGEMNRKLNKLNQTFNNSYCFSKDANEYKFSIIFETTNISFSLTQNGHVVSLDEQSTGFRYFFDMFFNILANDELLAGDIVLIDEPAICMHPESQKVIRQLLKEYGEKNGITFIYSTVSPFMSDLDYLDDLIVIEKEEKVSMIRNKFIEYNDDDLIKPIEESFTMDRVNYLHPANNTVFVEGVTDYNILVAFKKHLDNEDITIIPVNGIAKDIERLNYINRYYSNSLILVDSDKAGKDFKKKAEESNLFTNKVVDYDEVFESKEMKTIEDLFAENDKIKLGITGKAADKKFYKSKNFKNAYVNNMVELESKTIDNFNKLLEYLAA